MTTRRNPAVHSGNICGAVEYCDEHADQLIEQYEGVSFQDIHGDLIAWLPRPPALVLDVGAGSGRDARWLASQGFDVTAVEPSTGLRKWASDREKSLGIRWVDDRLPHLTDVKRLGTLYDFILLSAVLMFLPNEARVPSLNTLISLLRPGGRLAITVRLGLGEPTRGLLALTEGELALLMLDCTGVIALNTSDSQDHWNRDKLTWKTVVLEKPARPSAIETTRAYGRKAIASENDERCPI